MTTLRMGSCMDKHAMSSDDSVCGGGNVQVINEKECWDEKLSEAKNEGKLVVVKFSASWCSPCTIVAPFYAELSLKYPSFVFITTDVDELTEVSTLWDVRATPTFFFLKGGQKLDTFVGANKVELEKKFSKFADTSITAPNCSTTSTMLQ